MKHFNLFKYLVLPLLVMLGAVNAKATITTGTYTVGSGGTYADLASAISDLNSSTITGPVYFNILPGSYSGSGWQVLLNGITGSSAANRVTFQPSAGAGTVSITVTGSSTANYVFQLNDVSNVTIKNLSIANDGASFGRVISLTGACSNDSILNNTLTGVATTSNSDTMAVVHLGFNGAPAISGSGNVVFGNLIQNGSYGVTISGTSSSYAANEHITRNTITGTYYRGIAAYYLNNSRIRHNNISSTSTKYNAGIYLNGNIGAMQVSVDTINVSTTTAGSNVAIYGIYQTLTNSPLPTTVYQARLDSNVVLVAVTTGLSYPLYNSYCNNIGMYGNNFRGTSTTGQVMPPTLMYYCNNSSATNNTFSAIATGSGTVASGTYYFMSYGQTDTVRANVFNDSTTSGSNLCGGFYLMNNTSGVLCTKNIFNIASTSGAIFNNSTTLWLCSSNGSYLDSNKFNIYNTSGVIGNTSSSTSNGLFNNLPASATASMSYNTFNITSSTYSTSYGFWGFYPTYYMGSSSTGLLNNDTFNITFNSSNTFYMFGYYGMGYYPSNTSAGPTIKMNNCVWNANMPNGTSSFQPLCMYYGFYYTVNSEFKNNIMNINTSYGTVYTTPYYWGEYSTGFVVDNNKFNVNGSSAYIYNPTTLICGTGARATNNVYNTTNTSSGGIYSPYYGIYYSSGSKASGNTFNINGASSTVYPFYYYSLYANGGGDTIQNNTINITNTSGYIYQYNYYCQGTGNAYLGNTFNYTTTSGGIQFGFYYNYNALLFAGNTVKLTSTSGTIYGLYDNVASTSYSGPFTMGNKFDIRSNTGTTYGYYGYYSNGTKLYSNVFSTSTSGSSYLYYIPYGAYGDVLCINNTFHSNSTGSTNNYLFNHSNSSSSYSGKSILRNNIFSRTSGAASNKPFVINNNSYLNADYNLYYTPGTMTWQSGANPSGSYTSLNAWRVGSSKDSNSLVYDPGYTNAAGFNFTPDPVNPNSWSVQGRGIHVANDTLDITGAARPRTTAQGVPDLGAYEFTPTVLPPDAVATPATPSAGAPQVFTFGGDTVCTIHWGNAVPSTVSVKQYTGLQAPIPGTFGKFYEYIGINAPLGVYQYTPDYNYKDPWIGNVSSEANSRIAKSANGAPFIGYNFTNSITNTVNNIMTPVNAFDSLPARLTGVENARIGIRCVVAPSDLKHDGVAADSANESWNAEYSPIGYQLIVDNNPNTPTMPYSNIQFSSGNTYQIKHLNEDTKYYVHVRTICGGKDTSGWAIDSFTTLITCHAPNVQITSITDVRAVASWDTVKTGVGYGFALDQSPADPANTTYMIPKAQLLYGLMPGTDYYVHVMSYCNSVYPKSTSYTTVKFTTKFPAGVDKVNSKVMSVYPNPVTDVLTVQTAGQPSSDATVTVTDITGKVLRSVEITTTKTEINMTGLAAGTYIVTYKDKDKTEITKVTK